MSKMKIRLFTIADYEEEEIWLRKQHQNGLKLVKFKSPCFFIFEECEPEDMIYRLDYKTSELTQDYMQMLKDFGWKYVVQCLGWLYFRKQASEIEFEQDAELFSDNESRVNFISHIVATRLIPLGVIFLCIVIPRFLSALSGEFSNVWSTFISVVFGSLFVLYVYLIAYCSIKLKKIRDKYKR